jgi:lysophospholipase L1-like esterase
MMPILGGVARLKFDSSVAATFDGNSLVEGVGWGATNSSKTVSSQLALLAPISSQFAITNLGIGGQTFRQMNGLDAGSSSDVDSAYVAGKKNILFVWEGCNTINKGRTPQQAIADATDYIAARKAVHPWIVVILNTLPFETSASLNADLLTYNALLAQNYKAMGAALLVDVRQPGSPFAFTDYVAGNYTSTYWYDQIHLNNTGYGVIAQFIATAIKRLPAR